MFFISLQRSHKQKGIIVTKVTLINHKKKIELKLQEKGFYPSETPIKVPIP